MRNNTGNPVPSSDPRDRQDNSLALDEAVNSESTTFNDRTGKSRLTLQGMADAATSGNPAVGAAQDALDSANRAESEADRSEAEADRAESAASAAFVSADVYDDIASGLAAVGDDEQFQVVDGNEIIRYRRVNASTEEEVARYPNGSAVALKDSPALTGNATAENFEVSDVFGISTTELYASDPEASGYLMQMLDPAGKAGVSLDLNFRMYLRSLVSQEIEASTLRQSDGYRVIFSSGEFRHQISADGGGTWTTVMTVDRDTGATSIPFAPSAGGGAIEVAADIYVDSADGDDGNPGTAALPVATLSEVASRLAELGDGTTIGLKAGNVWRETLDVSAFNFITIAGYGDAESDGLPLVAADDVLSGTWETNVDRGDAHTNVFTLSHNLDDTEDNVYPNVWEDDYRLARVYSYEDCDSNPGSFYVPETGANAFVTAESVTLAVHPRSSTNPNTDGKTYEAVTRRTAIGMGDSSVARHVHARRAGFNSGPIWGGHHCLIDRCLAEDGYRHAALLESGEMRDTVGWMQTFDPNAGYIVLEYFTGEDIPVGARGVWRRCHAVIERPPVGESLAATYSGHGPGGGGVTLTEYEEIVCEDCVSVNGEITMDDTAKLTVIRPHLVNSSITARGETVVIDPFANITTPSNLAGAAVVGLTAAATSLNIDGLRAYIDGDMPGSLNALIRRLSGATSDITIERSAIYFGPSVEDGGAAYVLYEEDSGNTTLRDNVIDLSDAPVRGQFLRTTMDTEADYFSAYTGETNAYRPGNARARATDMDEDAAYVVANHEAGSLVSSDLAFGDPANGDWTVTGTSIPAGAGLARPNISYFEQLNSLGAALNWVIGR